MPEASEARTSVSHRQIIIVLLCLAYASLRMWGLTSSCLWFDEIFSVHAAEHSWGGILWFVAQDLIHPPLFYVLLKEWIAVGGESLGWLRSFSVFFSVLSIVPFLLLCRELKLKFTETAIALALFAANGSLIKYTQEVRMYSLLLFFGILSFWLFGRFYFRGKNIWLLTLVNVLLVYTHYFGWLVVLCEVLTILFFQRIKIRHVLTMTAIAMTSYVPWVWAIWKASAAGADVGQNIGWIDRPSLTGVSNFMLVLIEPFYYQQSSADPASLYFISLPILIIIAVAAALNIATLRDTPDKNTVYVLAIFSAAPILVAIAVSLILPYSVWGTRHLVIVFAPAIILTAKLIAGIINTWLRAVLICLLSIIFVAAFAFRITAPQPRYIWCSWDSLADRLTDSSQAGTGTRPRLYVFEDLAAYHFWFRGRQTQAYNVFLVKGVDGVSNDPAYFLPRGFDEVPVIGLDESEGDDFYIAYRGPSTAATGHGVTEMLASKKPISWYTEKGLRPEIVGSVTAGNETAYLLHLVR